MEQVEGMVEGVVAERPTARGPGLHESLWHRPLRWLLAAHVPLLLVFALLRDVDPLVAVATLVVPASLAVAAGSVGGAGVRAAMVAIGLVWSSWLLVVWSGGAVEAQLHGLVIIGLVGLYRDRIALALAAVGLAVLHLGPGLLRPELVHDHPAAVADPLVWTLASVAAIAAAGGLVLLTWRGAQAADPALLDGTGGRQREVDALRHQQQLADIYATAARRNQGMLERQLQVIEQMEAEESDPTTLQQLFILDHLTTRMNREAASMLVLAGGEPNRRVTGTPPLSEVVRGAVGEIEDYTRVQLELADDRAVEGRLVAALVHILSELVENAATYSPPTEIVRVVGATTADGGYRLHIIDRGIGLDDARLEEYNHLLTNPTGTAPRDNQRLGLDVVARLAGRHALPVQMSHNTDGPGVTASVHVPAHLLSVAPSEVLADAVHADPMQTPVAPAAVPSAEVSASPATAGPGTPSPVSPGGGAPRWASATGRAGSTGGTPAAAPSTQPPTPEPEPVARPAAPVRPAAIHTTARSATSWSYGGHLERRSDPQSPDSSEESRTRRFGRGSRSQVSGVAPRPSMTEPGKARPGAWPDAAPIVDREPPVRPTLGGRTTVGGRASTPQQPSPHPKPARRAAGGTPQTPDTAPGGPSPSAAPASAASQPAAGADRGAPAGSSTAGGAEDGAGTRSRPTAMELLAGIGETSTRPDEWESTASTDIGTPVGLGRGPFQGHPATHQPTSEAAASDGPADAPPPMAADSGPAPAHGGSPGADSGSPAAHGEPAGADSGPPAAETAGTRGTTTGHARGSADEELPQRRRGESLPPGLRGDADEQPQRSASAAPVSREESRSLLSSYQSRLQAGRKAAEDQVARNRPRTSPDEGATPAEDEAGSDDAP